MKTRKYIKEGDFGKIQPYSNSLLNRTVKYINSNKDTIISSFELIGYANNDNEFYLSLEIKNIAHNKPSAIDFLNSLSHALSSLATLDGICLSKMIRHFTLSDHEATLALRTSNIDFLRELIFKMHAFDPLDKETKKELMSYLKIPEAISEADVFDALANKNKKFDDALKLAKESDQEDILWKLGKKCESFFNDHFTNAITCYQEIPEDNAFYKNANKRIFELLMQYDSSNDSDEEKRTLLENTFRYALLSGDENARISEQLFHQLCGYKDLQPRISPLKGDPDMLIAIARQMNELKSENEALKKREEDISLGKRKDTPSSPSPKMF